MVGRTGVGKSSLVNSFVGKRRAATDAFEPCTGIVKHYAESTPWGRVMLIDTPGLAEPEVERNRTHLAQIRTAWLLHKVRAPELVYVTSVDQTRFPPEEERTVMALCKAFGRSLPEAITYVFTFAGKVAEPLRTQRVDFLQERLATCFEQASKRRVCICNGVILIDNEEPNWCKDAIPLKRAFLDG